MEPYLYAIIVLLVFWFVYKQFAKVKGSRSLNVGEFKKECKGQRLIDVREVREFKQGRIAGAINIPLRQIQTRLAEIPKDSPVFLYCRSEMRSKQAESSAGTDTVMWLT